MTEDTIKRSDRTDVQLTNTWDVWRNWRFLHEPEQLKPRAQDALGV